MPVAARQRRRWRSTLPKGALVSRISRFRPNNNRRRWPTKKSPPTGVMCGVGPDDVSDPLGGPVAGRCSAENQNRIFNTTRKCGVHLWEIGPGAVHHDLLLRIAEDLE